MGQFQTQPENFNIFTHDFMYGARDKGDSPVADMTEYETRILLGVFVFMNLELEAILGVWNTYP